MATFDIRVDQVTYLDPPRPAEDFRYFKPIGVEELGREAYTWFFWVTDRRAGEAQLTSSASNFAGT